jgi:AcrR family transcriptional regulator
VAREKPSDGGRPRSGDADSFRQFVVDAMSEKFAEKASRQAEKQLAKAARHVDKLDRLAQHLETLDVWTRVEPGARRPRLSRNEIAEAAVRIADAEGFDAVSMRRIAADLDAGTMTLYHYVRTKDELLMLVVDAVMGEVVVPPDQPLPTDWRDAITVIARRSRNAMSAHPWILDISEGPAMGPNSVRHFDQSVQAMVGLKADLRTKLDVITAVDEYVFGYCLHERNNFRADTGPRHEFVDYITELVSGGEYPALAGLIRSEGATRLWTTLSAHANDPGRFERNLRRLLDGIAASLH